MGKYSPLYDRRLAIITGKAEPTDEEVEAGKKSDEDSDEEDDDEEEEGAKIEEVDDGNKEQMEGIPEFWLTALRNHVPISETIEEKDEEVRLVLRLELPC